MVFNNSGITDLFFTWVYEVPRDGSYEIVNSRCATGHFLCYRRFTYDSKSYEPIMPINEFMLELWENY